MRFRRLSNLILLAAALQTGLSFGGESGQEEALVGRWHYYKKIYRGVEMPEPPEATLRLFFEFHADGSDRLYWWHEGEDDWCGRTGRYYISEGTIIDLIQSADPQNSRECARDPDMQPGRTSYTPFRFHGGDLHLKIGLGGEDLIFVWKRVSASTQ